jgi:hypothetical protein
MERGSIRHEALPPARASHYNCEIVEIGRGYEQQRSLLARHHCSTAA